MDKISTHALHAESDDPRLLFKLQEKYFYPRSPCGERHLHCVHQFPAHHISTHALHAESDAHLLPSSTVRSAFLPTLSMRRATSGASPSVHYKDDFYPRSPCGERHTGPDRCHRCTDFYPRSPCGERPFSRVLSSTCIIYFYPRSPCGERPLMLYY